MNVLLIYPEFPDTFWSFKHALKFVRKRASTPPLGLLTVAAMLPGEWEVRLVDTNVRPLTDDDLAWADAVMVTAMAVQQDSARQIIARCGQAGVRVIAGGPLFTAEPDAFANVDHLVLGEAELSLPPFLEDLAAGCAKRVYTADAFADVRTSPTPRWSLLNVRDYASMSVQFSRGCPFDCEFCNVTSLFGRRPRIKSGAQIVRELDALADTGWRGPIFFVDDNLIGQKKPLREDLLPALIAWRKRRYPAVFQTQVSINLADDPALMQQMAQAGFDTVFVGIETPDEAGLAACDKRQNLKRDLSEAVRTIHRAGLQVQGGFILGLDTDTPSIFQRQIEFIQQSGIVTAMVGLLQAPPGTRLYQRLTREGRLLGRFIGDNTDGATNILTRLPTATLRDGYRSVMRHLYEPDVYYQRIKQFLRDYRPPRAENPISREKIGAFLRSLFHHGVVSRHRLPYWKLLTWSLLHRPSQFALAIRLWIYGDHFRRICDLHLAS